MSKTIYTVTTGWNKLKNYNKANADGLLARISRNNKTIYSKFLNKENTILFEGSDKEQALKIKALLTRVGIYAVVDEKALVVSKKSAPDKNPIATAQRTNITIDLILQKIFNYTRLLIIFPVLAFSKICKRKISTKQSFVILAVVAFLGLYNVVFDIILNPIYDISYEYCTNSFATIETIFIIASIAKHITSLSVVSLTGISEFVSRISGFLENGLIALTAQTVLLKIIQQGFLFKTGLTFGFGFGIFDTSRKFGEKIVFFTVFLYAFMPLLVVAETYVFNQVTSQQIQNINDEYGRNGGAIGLSKKAAVGVTTFVLDKAKEFISNETPNAPNKDIKGLKDFFATILNGIIYILVSVILLNVLSPYILYRLFKTFFLSAIDSDKFVSLFEPSKIQKD
ncbi:hypothetical protein [Desulfovibrio sp. TomC]|uniref:hypothetical protein n=1 Tax=Desulfovibrio sp. TomC TaxID=1562888 RepID=UPI000AB16F9F|nr:hypothetical protein [Desulfovibrio sp. TomC]